MTKKNSPLILFFFIWLFFTFDLSANFEETKKTLVIASSNNFPPINMLENEKLTGFGRDLSDAVLKKMGFEVKHIDSPIWTEVLQWLDSGKADLIHDTGYTKEREAYLEFSHPIIEMPESIFVQSHRLDINGLNSLKTKTVACVNKHISHLYLQRFPQIKCRMVNKPVEGLYLLVSGEVDAFVYPQQIVEYFSQSLRLTDKIKVVGEPLRKLSWSMTVKKGNTKILKLLNEGIDSVRESGEYETIYNKWFGYKLLSGYTKTETIVFLIIIIFLSLAIGGILILLFINHKVRMAREELMKSENSLLQAKKQIAYKENEMRLLLNSTHEGIYGIDLKGLCTFANQSCLNILGYASVNELIGHNMHKMIHHHFKNGGVYHKESCLIFKAFKEGKGVTVDNEVLWRKGGTSFDAEYNSFPIVEKEKIIGAVVSFIDITERKVQAEKMKQSEDKFRSISENSQMGIFIFKETIVYANKALIDISSYSSKELYQMKPWDIIIDETLKGQMKSTALKRLKGETFPKQYDDLKIMSKNGLIKTVRVMTETISFDEGYAGLVTIVDITDITETKQKLKLLAQAIEQTDELVRITDKNGVISYVNDAYVAHTGYKHTELIGQNASMIKSGVHAPEFYNNLWETIISGKTYSNTITNRKKSGEVFYEELMITPMSDKNNIITNFVATGKDISSRIKLEHEIHLRATTDYLTQVYNRQKGNELLDSEIERVERYESTFAVLMLDIDNFKAINDQYGHDVGDYALLQLCKIILLHIRKSDSLIRWGGDEFIIIAPQSSQDEIMLFAEKIRVEIDSYSFEKLKDMSSSIGVALYLKSEGKKPLLQRVDKALYKAKESGRNCVKFL